MKISKAKKECSQCEQAFLPGHKMSSMLFIEGEEWLRKDLCSACAEKQEDVPLASWQIYIEKSSQKKMVLSEDAIWQVLRKGMEDVELREKPLTYILCLMMLRKRKLRVLKTHIVKGYEYQLYSNQSRKIEIDVKTPMLGPAAFSKLQKEIGDFFGEA